MSHHAQKPGCRKSWLRPHATVRWSNNLLGFESVGVSIERFHSRGQPLRKFIGTNESVCIRKECNSHRIVLVHQHGGRFIVLEHQYGRRDVMWKRSISIDNKLKVKMVPRILIYHVEGMVFFTKTMQTCWRVYSKVSFSTLIWQFFFFKKGKWLSFFIVRNIAVASMATTLTTMTFSSVEARFSHADRV